MWALDTHCEDSSDTRSSGNVGDHASVKIQITAAGAERQAPSQNRDRLMEMHPLVDAR